MSQLSGGRVQCEEGISGKLSSRDPIQASSRRWSQHGSFQRMCSAGKGRCGDHRFRCRVRRRPWKKVESEKLNILPLVVDFSRPSAAQGWRNRECASFLDRAGGAFDAVIMFGILHHLLVSERIPLKEILEVAKGLTSSWLLIEFVPPQDEMFQILARGRDSLHADLNESRFEGDCKETFEIVRKQRLPGMERCLYLLHKRA